MRIVWSKHPEREPGVTCYRDDGSTTYQSGHQGSFFAFHDLVHYAVETTLGYHQAFWGIIAGGRDLGDFGSQGGPSNSREYHPEAIYAEVIVGLVSHVVGGNLPADSTILNPMLADGCKNHDRHVIELSQIQWNSIVEVAQELHAQFRALPADGKLELRFPPNGSGTI